MRSKKITRWTALGLALVLMPGLAVAQSGARTRHPSARKQSARPSHASHASTRQTHVPTRQTHAPTRQTHASTRQAPASTRRFSASRRTKQANAKARTKGPVVSRAQMELAQEMARDAYALGRGLEPPERMVLLTRLLYTLRPEVMAAEKKQWAEELFELARKLPVEGARNATGPLKPKGAGSPGTPGFHPSELTAGSPGPPGTNGPTVLRNQAIATAAARLALYDSERSLELLDTLPSQGGRREDARTMAARLVFAIYLRQHGAAGVQTLLAHATSWGEHGGFPYAASAVALARLSADEYAAEDFFRQALTVFVRGHEGAFGVGEFGELLERAVAMEAISEESAEEAGRAIITQAAKLTGTAGGGAGEGEAVAPTGGTEGQSGAEAGRNNTGQNNAKPESVESEPVEPGGLEARQQAPLSDEASERLADALNHVRLAAPKAFAQAAKSWPELASLRVRHQVSPVQELKVDAGLQASFAELAEAMRERRAPETIRETIARGLEQINARYRAGACAGCGPGVGAGHAAKDAAPGDPIAPVRWDRAAGLWTPDAQSWALVSLAAYASPMTIGAQLKAIEEPFWRAYFLAIAAQQVGEPTRVADPTARRPIGKEEAEPEE